MITCYPKVGTKVPIPLGSPWNWDFSPDQFSLLNKFTCLASLTYNYFLNI